MDHGQGGDSARVAGQEVPNIGVGYLEALFYLGTSFLITWTL